MLSRRDKLLSRPWQQRRYENHRRKVQSALPAIDAGPPTVPGHVCIKLKKKQTEKERCIQIERDNLRLLQKMEDIMKRNRLDNHWVTPQPNFLNRVALYSQFPENRPKTTTTDRKLSNIKKSTSSSSLVSESTHRKSTESFKNTRCIACFPPKYNFITDDRRLLPWEQESSKYNQNILPNQTLNNEFKKSSNLINENIQKKKESRSDKLPQNGTVKTPSIILTRGNLKLSLNFPPDSQVKLRDGNVEKYIVNGFCGCKGYTKLIL